MYKRNYQSWLKHIDFILWDVVALQLAFLTAYAIRQHSALPYTQDIYRTLAFVYAIVDILIAAAFNTMHNVVKRGYYEEFVQTLKQALLVFLVVILFMFSLQSGEDYSRITIFLTMLFHVLYGYGIHILWKRVLRRFDLPKNKSSMILVVEEGRVPEALDRASSLQSFAFSGIVLTDRDAEGETIQGIPVVANLDNAADYICRMWVDEVFVFPSHLAEIELHESALFKSVEGIIDDGYSDFIRKDYEARFDEEPPNATVSALIEACRQMSVPVHLRLPVSNVAGKSFVQKVGGYNVLTMASNYASPLQLIMKRALDIVGGIVGSIVAIVVIAVVGPKIKKESPGPILFKQTRIGLNGKKFQMFKIRSMYLDAEERKQELMNDNRVSDGMMFKLDWDPRIIGNKIVDGQQVTGIGEKIRSSSWDEWPQFFNILLGQMSLVGTRPPTVDEWEKYRYHHRARLATKPGLTGMWQVSGRSRITDFEEVVRLDTEYINHWSVALDCRILLKTVKAVFNKDGAM